MQTLKTSNPARSARLIPAPKMQDGQDNKSIAHSRVHLFDPLDIEFLLETSRQERADLATSELSSEQIAWANRLERILRDERGPARCQLFADASMLDRLTNLRETVPNCRDFINVAIRAAMLSIKASVPFRIPPILLLGAPGCGKTHVARSLAEALGVPMTFIAGDMMSDRGTVSGLALSWRAARPGSIAETLLSANTISPMILVDELDKMSPIHAHEKPMSFLHSTLEPENARHFKDEYLNFEMRAESILWIATANSQLEIPESILDRFLIMNISLPDKAALRVIATSIYRKMTNDFGQTFLSDPTDDLIETLSRLSPRRIRRILELAFGFAAEAGSREVEPTHIGRATALIEGETERRPVGFIRHRYESTTNH